jgi:CRISPR-associated protein Cas10/Csm1 subtype III-A
MMTEQAWDAHAEAERDARQGRLLLTAEVVTLNPASDDDLDAIAGVAFALKQRSQVTPGIARKEIDLNRLSRYVPHKSDGSATEFVELAATARGASMLGVLKADADSLGAVLRSRLTGAADLAPLQSLSKKLEQFFGAELNEMISSPDSKWSSIYTVFAGGDDLLLVGPWDIIIDFAGHVREVFLRKFKSDGPTISAGCATIKPKLTSCKVSRRIGGGPRR